MVDASEFICGIDIGILPPLMHVELSNLDIWHLMGTLVVDI